LFFGCQSNETADCMWSPPDLYFDGRNLVDRNYFYNRVVCRLSKKVALPPNYNFNNNLDLYAFLKKNKSLNIKNIKIFESREDYFFLYVCEGLDKFLSKDKLNKAIIVYNVTYTTHKKISTLIAEYSFKNEADLLKAFKIYYNYSAHLRNLRRDKYCFQCDVSHSDSYYFVTIYGNKLYLIGDSYNYHYPAPGNNIESEIEKDSNIMMDDVYELINNGLRP